MSTTSLQSYGPPASLNRAPSYTAEPLENEQRIALNDRTRARPSGSFVKQSKNGHVKLRLTSQENGIAMPVYGIVGLVQGSAELDPVMTEGTDSVEVKIEGRLKLNEIAEGGTASAKLVLDTELLWKKDSYNQECPSKLDFALTLPTTFANEGISYPLPPTYSVKLKGLPGFTASIDYSVSILINRPDTVPSMVPIVKSKTLGIHIGTTIVSTPFSYYPRARPSVPLPRPLVLQPGHGFNLTPEWRTYETISRAKQSKLQDVILKLYVPKSRIFCFKQKIPFHLSIQSSTASLAAFLPYGPSVGHTSPKGGTKIEVLRQATVDITNPLVTDAKQDMWRVDSVGQGTFGHTGTEPGVTTFSGEIEIFDTVQVGGFKAAGLGVKDCIVLSMTPTNPGKCPFTDFRLVVPIRFATDSWTADGTGIGISADVPFHVNHDSAYFVPSSPEEEEKS